MTQAYLRARYYDSSIGRFITEDPAKDGLNWYVFCRNNPVMFVDRNGLMPSIEEAALMSEHIYHHNKNDERVHREVGGTGWRLIDVWEDSGCKMGIYIRGDEYSSYSGPVEYTVAFKGTDRAGDWVDNLLQPCGKSDAMTAAINMSYGFTAEFGADNEITFVGHSKGGAEAISAAVKTNRNAIVFNSAIPVISEYGLSTQYYDGGIIHYSVYGEAISSYLGLPQEAYTFTIPTQHPIDDSSGWREFWDRVANHHMSAVLDGLKEMWE